MSVTRDATSGKALPQSAAEWTAFYSGWGLALSSNPSFLWLCQEASGNLADSIGACTMTAANSPSYRTAVTGWSSKAVSWANNSTSRFDNTTTPPNGNASSLALFGFFYVSSNPGADAFMASMTDFAIHLVVDSTGHEKIYDNSITAGATVISDGVVRPFLIVYNRAAATCKLYTPTETVDGGYASSAGAHTVLGAYPALATPAGGCLYAAEWTGTAAEMSSAQALVLVGLLNNPIVTLPVSPSSATITPPGTQALSAIANKLDTTTQDVTTVTVWTTSNASIATVSSSGVVTGVSAGTCTITATTGGVQGTSAITVMSGVSVPLPVVGVDVPDHQALALSRLPEQDKNKTNIAALLNVCVSPAVALESALWQLLTQRRVTTALGSNLDAIGKLVGQPRNGLSDVDYQTYIAARISANRSSGLIEDLLRVAKTLINNTAAVITASYGGAGTVIVTITGITRTTAQGAALAAFEQAAVAAGIRVVVAYSTSVIGSTFRYDVGPGYDVGHYADGIG